jgi:anti-anti-sigma factor
MESSGHFKLINAEQEVCIIELALPSVLDGAEFDALNESLLNVVADHPDGRWVIDLTSVTYLGSSMLGLLVNIRQRVKQSHGALRCRAPGRQAMISGRLLWAGPSSG